MWATRLRFPHRLCVASDPVAYESERMRHSSALLCEHSLCSPFSSSCVLLCSV